MKKSFKIKSLVIAVFAFLGIGWLGLNTISDTFAEGTGTSIFVSPMTQKIILTPGDTYTGAIVVSNGNSATADLEYTAKVSSYNTKSGMNGKGDYGAVDVENATERNIMKDWITLSKDSGTIKPNNNESITFTIKVPKDAPAGAQYASILVSENDKADSSKSASSTSAGITNKFQLASVIYANIAGETVEKGAITENNIPTILTTNKLEATSMVRNDGNIYTDAKYTLQVWPMFSNEELCTNEENAENNIILPNTERYHVQSCELPAVGIFKAKQIVTIFGEESILEKTVLVCPIWLMVIFILIIVGIVITIVILIKKHKKGVDTD